MSNMTHTIDTLHGELIANVHRAARALPPWPADVPRPTDEDLDACDRLADYGDCGRCVSPAQHLPEITVEQARDANAANVAKPRTIFGRRLVLPRAALTIPERIECYCAHVDQTGYGWPTYGAMIDRWPAQATLRAAYDHVSDLLPELRDLISARWIDREAVLTTLVGNAQVGKVETNEDDAARVEVTYGTKLEGERVIQTVTLSHGRKPPVTIEGDQSVRIFKRAHEANGTVVKWKDFTLEDLTRRANVVEAAQDAARAARRQEAEERDAFFDDEDSPRDGLDGDILEDQFKGKEEHEPDSYRRLGGRIRDKIEVAFLPGVCHWEHVKGGVRLLMQR